MGLYLVFGVWSVGIYLIGYGLGYIFGKNSR